MGLRIVPSFLSRGRKFARENKSLNVKRKRGNGDLHVDPAGDGSFQRVMLFLIEATFQG